MRLPGSAAASRRSSRAASASASRSPAPSSTGRACCCSTSRSARSTSSCARRCRWSWAHPGRGGHHVRLRDPRPGGGAHHERPDRGLQPRAGSSRWAAGRALRATGERVRGGVRGHVERARARRPRFTIRPEKIRLLADGARTRRGLHVETGQVATWSYVGIGHQIPRGPGRAAAPAGGRQNLETTSDGGARAEGPRRDGGMAPGPRVRHPDRNRRRDTTMRDERSRTPAMAGLHC